MSKKTGSIWLACIAITILVLALVLACTPDPAEAEGVDVKPRFVEVRKAEAFGGGWASVVCDTFTGLEYANFARINGLTDWVEPLGSFCPKEPR